MGRSTLTAVAVRHNFQPPDGARNMDPIDRGALVKSLGVVFGGCHVIFGLVRR